jgi:hypothetical protein
MITPAALAYPYSAIWVYPWDLLAEGLDESLGHIASLGIRGINLAVSYHSGMLLLPHNPRQKVRFLEDGAVYFQPQPDQFHGLAIQPRVSELAHHADPLAAICAAAQRHGIEVIAWTVCCHNTYQGERHSDLVLQNAFGDPYPFALCPSQPEVQCYLEALLRALSAYPLRAIQLESYDYMGFYHGHHHEKVLMPLGSVAAELMGLCFCPACQRAAEQANLDFEALRRETRQYLEGVLAGHIAPATERSALSVLPVLALYYELRERTVTSFLHRLIRASAKPLSPIGISASAVRELGPRVGEVTICTYRVAPEDVAADIRAARNLVGSAPRLAIGIEATPLTSPSATNLAGKVRAAWDAGANALYFYNYGLMPLSSLQWLGEALK